MTLPDDNDRLAEACRKLLDGIASEPVPPRIRDLARELAQRLAEQQARGAGSKS